MRGKAKRKKQAGSRKEEKRLIRNKGRRSAGRENYEGTKKNKREKQYTWKKESQTHFLFLK
ncbi:MAG: hypothetical protein WBI12_13325 [Methanosarcina flavescens]|jgi:hypothetical protein|uniref:Uncharacterized protein n=1 Tax=Methanosarcina flavescens TaxID=1715806 RepID=A0A660HV36_9EURY|nr:hypothetical protein AOB57_013760 [Methanosarcina flavescens]